MRAQSIWLDFVWHISTFFKFDFTSHKLQLDFRRCTSPPPHPSHLIKLDQFVLYIFSNRKLSIDVHWINQTLSGSKNLGFYLSWGQFAVKHVRCFLRLFPPNYSHQLHVVGEVLQARHGFYRQIPPPSQEEHKRHRIPRPNLHRKAKTDPVRLVWLHTRWLTSAQNI